MDIIRRNTDYALRLATILAGFSCTEESVSAKILSKEAAVPYPLTCKLLQKMQKKGIIKSEMGPKGGYCLARSPGQISLLEVIQIIQGPICVNRCFLGSYKCPLKGRCPLHKKLMGLQNEIVHSLDNTYLSDLIDNQHRNLEAV